MIFELRPPETAGPLHIGAAAADTVEILKSLGTPLVLCRPHGSPPGWGVQRSSGLFISALFDPDGHLEAIELGRPEATDDIVTYDGLDMFTTPAEDIIAQLQHCGAVHEEEDGHAFIAPGLCLSLWRSTPESPDDQESRFFESILIARPGYYD